MKGEDTTERVRMMSQKRNRKWMATMEWNERIGMEMDKSDCDWSCWEEEWYGKNGNEWIENIDANENEKQIWVVMKVMELK